MELKIDCSDRSRDAASFFNMIKTDMFMVFPVILVIIMG